MAAVWALEWEFCLRPTLQLEAACRRRTRTTPFNLCDSARCPTSSHGRTSASTLDDTFSGRAEATSSTGATSEGESESEDEYPAARRQKLDATGAARLIYPSTETPFIPTTETANGSVDDADYEDGLAAARSGNQKPGLPKSKPATHKHRSTPSLSKPALQKVPKAPAL